MDFRTYFLGLPLEQRKAYAATCGSTVGALNQVAYAGARVSLGRGEVLASASKGAVSLEEIPLAESALAQLAIRKSLSQPRKAA